MARPAKLTNDHMLLEAALEGLELQRKRVEDQIKQVRSMLGGRRNSGSGTAEASEAAPAPRRRRRTMSPEARKRIAAAQKKRWAEYHKQNPS